MALERILILVVGLILAEACIDVCPGVDLNILIDTGMEPSQLQPALTAVKELIKMIPLNAGGVNIALFRSGSDEVRVQGLVGENGYKGQLFEKLLDFEHTKRVDLGSVFERMAKHMDKDGREEARNIILLFSDGLEPHPNSIHKNVVRLRRAGVTFLGVVMGTASSESQMKAIVSDPIQDHLFEADSDFYSKDVLPGAIVLRLLSHVCVCPVGTRRIVDRCEPIEPKCDGQDLEIVFMLDTSFSIHETQLQTYKNLVDRLTSRFRLGPDSQKIALVTLNRKDPQILADLGAVQDSKALAAILQDIVRVSTTGTTPASEALNEIMKNVYNLNGSGNTRRAIVLLTDGSFNQFNLAKIVTDELAKFGVEIYAVSFEKAVRIESMSKITKSLKRIHVIKNDNAELAEILDVADNMAKQICGEKIPDDVTEEPQDDEPQEENPECGARKTYTVCENKSPMHLKCSDDTDQKLRIISASYGRRKGDTTTCASPVPRQNIVRGDEDCRSPKSLLVLQQSCEGKKNCLVSAENAVFHDPCVGTYKYLEVEYQCCKLKRQVVCERESSMALVCAPGQKLDILSAMYGRKNRDTCPHAKMSDVDCESDPERTMYEVKRRCNDEERCLMPANNAFFGGDPCPGTYKYLEVEHRCLDGVNVAQQTDTDDSVQTEQPFVDGVCHAARDVLIFLEWRPLAFGGDMLADMKNLALKIVSTLHLAKDRVNLVFGNYGHTVHLLKGITSYSTTEEVHEKIKNWEPEHGGAGLMVNVMEIADRVWYADGRPKVAVIITGGMDSSPSRSAAALKKLTTEGGVQVIGVVMNSYLQKQEYDKAYEGVKKLFNGEAKDSEAELSDENLFLYDPPKLNRRQRRYDAAFMEAVSKKICGVEQKGKNKFGKPQPPKEDKSITETIRQALADIP